MYGCGIFIDLIMTSEKGMYGCGIFSTLVLVKRVCMDVASLSTL